MPKEKDVDGAESSSPLPGQRRLKIRAAEKVVAVPSLQLLTALRAVSLAASEDSDRPQLNAVHFAASDELVLTATDGHWMASYAWEAEELPATPVSMLVALEDVRRLMPLLAIDAKVRNQARVNFESGVVELTDGTVLPLLKIVSKPPPYHTLWATSKPRGVPSIAWSTHLMMRAMRAFKVAAAGDTSVRADFRDSSKGIELFAEKVPELRALLMPANVLGVDRDEV